MKKGFTLIELLLVIGILVILITATIIAINPFRQFALANNASRYSGTTTIMDSVYQNVVDNAGLFNCAVLPTVDNVCMGAGALAVIEANVCDSFYDIHGCIIPTYVSNIPFDPQGGGFVSSTNYNTRYSIKRDATTGRITICAPDTQVPPEATDICLTR